MADLTAKDILTTMRDRVEALGGLINDDECPRWMLRDIAEEDERDDIFAEPDKPEAIAALAALDEAAMPEIESTDDRLGGRAEAEANRLEQEADLLPESLAYFDRALALV